MESHSIVCCIWFLSLHKYWRIKWVNEELINDPLTWVTADCSHKDPFKLFVTHSQWGQKLILGKEKMIVLFSYIKHSYAYSTYTDT